MVRERNQSQLAFFTKSSTESQPSHKLSRSDIQNDVHHQEDIRGTTQGNHCSKPATSSSISGNSTGNGKESVPLGSEQSPLSSSNVPAPVIQVVEIPPASVPLEHRDDPDVQETIYEPEPSFPRIDNVATEPEKEMIVALQEMITQHMNQGRPEVKGHSNRFSVSINRRNVETKHSPEISRHSGSNNILG